MSHAVLGGQNWFVAAASLIRRRVVRDYLQGAVWVLPGLGIVLGLGAGALLSGIQVRPGSLLERLAFQGSPSPASCSR